MKNLTKGIAAVGALAMLTGVGACGSNTADDKGHVYFLNNKPEVVNQWNELAEMYTKQTGVKVDIQSATSGSYESTLSSELAKNNAPTMFGIGGFDQYAKYKDYLEPLQDTEAYKLLNDQGKQMAHKDGDNVYGLPYAAEWFGIRERLGATEFLGYETTEATGKLLALVSGGAEIEKAGSGETVLAIFDRTPFYAESGGQAGDVGEIEWAGGKARVAAGKVRGQVHGVCAASGRRHDSGARQAAPARQRSMLCS